MAGLLLLCMLAGAATAQPRFKGPTGGHGTSLGQNVLSPAERDYLRSLPEVRVGLQRVGAPPYETVSDDEEVAGFQAELLAYLARAFGIRIRPVIYDDWPSVLRAARARDVDMVLTLGVTPERLDYLAFTLGTVPVPVAAFGRAAPLPPLERARIAVEAEYWTVELVRRQYPKATLVEVRTTTEALNTAASGDVDYYVGGMLEAMAVLDRTPVRGLEMRELIESGAGFYHFGVRKDWAPLAALLNRGIANLRPAAQRMLAPSAASLPSGARLTDLLVPTHAEATQLALHPVWRMGAVRGLAMLNDVGARGEHIGIGAEYAEQVARRVGVGLETVPFDSVADMLAALDAGRIDFAPLLTRTAERAQRFAFSEPYMEMPYILVARRDGPLYWDLGSLRGRRLALALQHPLRDVLARSFPDIAIVDAANGTEALRLVAEGRADAAVELKVFANLHINADDGTRLRAIGPVNELPAQFHFAASRDAAALVPLVNRALASVPAVEHERMLRRWVAMDLVAPFPWRRWAPTLAVSAAALATIVGGTLWWTRRLAKEVRRRRRLDEQLDDIGRTMPGVAFRYVLDANGQLVGSFFSSGAESFLGVRPDPLRTLLSTMAPRLDPAEAERVQALQQQALQSGQPFRTSVLYHHPDGRDRWMHCEAVRSTTREGRAAWTGYLIDTTRERELQEQVAREADERFVLLAAASHELRAPAHTLSLALQSVPESAVEPPHQRALGIARAAAGTLGQLLDELLDAARLSAGHSELRPQDFDLHALLAQIGDGQASDCAAKGLAFTRAIAPDVPRTVRADPLRLKQVLLNLLSNATKYTAAGGIQLRVELDELPAGRAALAFTVQDSGRGIDDAVRSRLFEPFASGSDGTPGSTGLGLSVCRRLVSMMAGDIQLDSTAGRGTTVTVRVPLEQAERAGLRSEGALLLCDDDEVSRLLMSEFLGRMKLPVLAFASAEEALARWREGGVRLVVTDLNMPGLGGRGLIEALRADEARTGAAGGRTAIVVCSGDPPPADDAAPLHDAYISKPVDLNALVDTLSSLGVKPS